MILCEKAKEIYENRILKEQRADRQRENAAGIVTLLHQLVEPYLDAILQLEVAESQETSPLHKDNVRERVLCSDGVAFHIRGRPVHLLIGTSDMLSYHNIGLESRTVKHDVNGELVAGDHHKNSYRPSQLCEMLPTTVQSFVVALLSICTSESVAAFVTAASEIESQPAPEIIYPAFRLPHVYPGGHPSFDKGMWRAAVAIGDTDLGYWEWVYSKLTARFLPCAKGE